MTKLQQLTMAAMVTTLLLGGTDARPTLAPLYHAEERLLDDYIVVLNVSHEDKQRYTAILKHTCICCCKMNENL